MRMNAELQRLNEKSGNWKRWGPYLSERQWGTVREDYSDSGNAWDYFTHDQARSRAYRRGEDGIAGISDDKQLLCFALACWNGTDPIIKERLFGLTNSEGNHGEDVKEYYYYLDSTPTHSYMKYLYKYPQHAFPYDELVETNAKRTRFEPEYELIDTGIFADNRYFDIFVEYAKTSPEDILVKITVHNRGPENCALQLLPTVWFRNTWHGSEQLKPELRAMQRDTNPATIAAFHPELPPFWFYAEGSPALLFTENETNTERVFGTANPSPYVKDGINNFLVDGEKDAINPDRRGTKAAGHYQLQIPAGKSECIRLRLTTAAPKDLKQPFGAEFEASFASRLQEADEFFAALTPAQFSADQAAVHRQAIAGMLWSKQFYFFDVHNWLSENQANPLKDEGRGCRNKEWFHMLNRHIISMPDKWEYPWYAAWDLAFHAVALSSADLDFAKEQLELTLGELYLHPNGQIPAYEWNFSDVNPPVQAWAALFLYRTEANLRGSGDLQFLERVFSKLMLNFTWWVNRKDRLGKNLFEGGFLGLDNIGVFDRSAPLPTGGFLEQADGTGWMALFCQNMFELGSELAGQNSNYDSLSIKFADHFLFIAWAMNRSGPDGMWDEEDGFYYDVLRLPNGEATRLKVRSLVGLLPICATTVIEGWQRERMPKLIQHFAERLQTMPELAASVHPLGPENRGIDGRGLASLVTEDKLRRILSRMLDENEFLSPYGIRALSRFHEEHPYTFLVGEEEHFVRYQPAESTSGAFGGNSNWRGPVWMPMNALLVRALLQFYLYYGDNFKIEFPTGSGTLLNLFEVAHEIVNRLSKIFLRGENGQRPVFGGNEKFQNDPHFRDHVLFYEYFHGDDGSGIGASHQTGWTGAIGRLMELFSNIDAKSYLESGKRFQESQQGNSK